MNAKLRTLKLTQKESPIGFDYHGLYDALIVATPGAVSFYRIVDHGTPNQLFYYDESRKMKGIRVQQHDKALIAAIHDKEVTLWDPKNVVAPMTQALVTTSGVTDCQWCKEDPNMFSMTLNSGMISVWDMRSLNRPAQQLLLGRKSQKMEWCPVDRHLLAVATENKYVLLWDTRKLPSNISTAPSNVDECYMLLEPEGGLVDFTWASEVSVNNMTTPGCPYIWTVSDGSNTLGLHRISRPNQIFHASLEISHDSKACVSRSKVVAQPNGQGLMMYYEDKDDSLTKFNYIDVNHHQKIDTDTTIAKSCGKIMGGHWRFGSSMNENHHKSFIAFTSTGQLHIFDEVKQKHSYNHDEKLVSKGKGLSDSMLTNNGSKSKVKSAFSPLKSATSYVTSIQHGDFDLVSPHYVTNTMVGPKTFLILVKDEVQALGAAVQHGNLEGIRVGGIDHFARQIVLEMLIPAADPFIINDFNARSNGHFRQQELDQFYHNGAPGRTVELSIVFPMKTSEFWAKVKFSLENKSNHQIDQETMTSIVDEISALTKNRLPQRRQVFRHGGRTGNTVNESMLVYIAKMACKRIIQTWQKKTVEGMNISFGSHKQSQDELSIVSPETKNETDEGQAIYTICLQKTEGRAFFVPFPVVSAGLFNGKGELILFGNAQLRMAGTAARPCCEYVESIGAAAYPGSSLHSTNTNESENNNAKLRKHKSYAHLLANKYMKKSASEGAVSNKSCATETSENNTISTRLSASQHSHLLNFSQHSRQGKVSGALDNKKENRPIGDLYFNDEDDEAEYDDDEEEEDEDESSSSSDEDRSDGDGERIEDDDEDVNDSEEADYQPGFDFEESKGLSSVIDTKSKRRVSYNQRSEPTAVDQSSMLPVRKYSNLSDFSSTQYFIADLDSKYSDSSGDQDVKIRDQRVEFTVYGSVQKTSQFLAKHYSLGPGNVVEDDLPGRVAACRHNMQIVEKYFPGNRSLVQFWSLLAVCLDVSAVTDVGGLISWNHSALGKSLFQKLMQFLVSSKDLQTWAVAVCVIGNTQVLLRMIPSEQQRIIFSSLLLRNESSLGLKSSNSNMTSLLVTCIESMVYRYSQILQQWGEILKSTEVVNHMMDLDDIEEYVKKAEYAFPIPRAQEDNMSLLMRCMFCDGTVEDRYDLEQSVAKSRLGAKQIALNAQQKAIKKPWCFNCNVFGIYCAICLLPVRSVASICQKCGHGGHEHDLSMWFSKNPQCPTGCGCHCRSSDEDSSNEDEMVRFVDDDSEKRSDSPERMNPVARSVFRSISFRMLNQAAYMMPFTDAGVMFGNEDYFL